MKNFILIILVFFSAYTISFSQHTNAPLNEDYYHLIDRYDIKNGNLSTLFTGFKPFSRSSVVQLTDSLLSKGQAISNQDKFNIQYLRADNWEYTSDSSWLSRAPVLKKFFKSKADFFYVKEKSFQFRIQPVIYFSLGFDNDGTDSPFINTRGVQLHGSIDKKLGFYAYIGENQASFPGYVRSWIQQKHTVPYEGFWKSFGEQGVDYLVGRGYLNFKVTKHITTQFGYDKNFIGNGYRSMILSDFGNSYLFLKFKTKIWRFEYTNLFAELYADINANATGSISGSYPKKYMALHRLSFNFSDNFNLGVFESVIFGRADSLQTNFELRYLNPMIFYRPLEQQSGSADDMLLGADFKWNFAKRFQLYGQFVLDEFVLNELKSGDGWWGNKFGAQLGFKYIDVFSISNLDLQVETNLARPYLYSDKVPYTNYSHYTQPLAHPLGANFKETIAIVRYQPTKRLHLSSKLQMAHFGTDTDGANWGGDIMKNYNEREQEYGNTIGQGVKNELFYGDFIISYQLKHNLFVDLQQIYRKLDSEDVLLDDKSLFSSLALRWNIGRINHLF
ncbi:hypothetical protein [Xanthovirga aplysinae]|uniref:hypothetical protein n=1 Tax=Xanthovirga aplysinae TaxID=2529853 RepID=UPI0012BB95CB|nr:hypothetical protein [Xanthovirga aplysinae]MTI31161.1 hypothetical protein [Xanthovirga aplysinae]